MSPEGRRAGRDTSKRVSPVIGTHAPKRRNESGLAGSFRKDWTRFTLPVRGGRCVLTSFRGNDSLMDFYKEWLGIPDGPRPPDHYELLRVKRFEDDAEKIKAHYKKLNAHVRKYASGQYSVQSQDILNELAKAMLCLTDEDRKAEYDESLGREVPAKKDAFGRMPLLDALVKQGKITRQQKTEVEEFSGKRGLSHRDAVVQMKFVEADSAAQALAIQLGFAYVDLEDMLPEDDTLDMVPRQLVKKHSFIPLFIDDDRLLIACVDEIEHELEDELRLRFGVPIRPVIATPRAVSQGIAKYYAPGVRDEAKSTAAVQAGKAGGGKAAAKGGEKKKGDGGAGKKATAEAHVPFKELPQDEQARRKQTGILIMCWSFMIPMAFKAMEFMDSLKGVMIDHPMLGKIWMMAFITGPLGVIWVTQKYWK